ncbi:hypothetical protein, partial [Veillonella atypica]|uniref:hypothetical protein n=1 Tax=Veillonella atypica TaxID=39777 RepID=UPI003AF4C66C
MIAKFDFGPAKPEGRRQTRPVENFAVICLYKRIYYERGLFFLSIFRYYRTGYGNLRYQAMAFIIHI